MVKSCSRDTCLLTSLSVLFSVAMITIRCTPCAVTGMSMPRRSLRCSAATVAVAAASDRARTTPGTLFFLFLLIMALSLIVFGTLQHHGSLTPGGALFCIGSPACHGTLYICGSTAHSLHVVLSPLMARPNVMVLSSCVARSTSVVLSPELARPSSVALSSTMARSPRLALSRHVARSLARSLSGFSTLPHHGWLALALRRWHSSSLWLAR
jgi:hypothetical protein